MTNPSATVRKVIKLNLCVFPRASSKCDLGYITGTLPVYTTGIRIFTRYLEKGPLFRILFSGIYFRLFRINMVILIQIDKVSYQII